MSIYLLKHVVPILSREFMVICHTFKWTKSPPTQKYKGMLIFPLFHFVHLLRTPFSSSLFLVTMHHLSPLVLMTKPLDFSLGSPACQIILFSETFPRSYAPLFHFFSKLEGTIHSHLPWMPSRLLSLPKAPVGSYLWPILSAVTFSPCLDTPAGLGH